MTKAKARARAKARAAAKILNPGAEKNSTKPEVKPRPGQFDPKSSAAQSVGATTNIKSAAMRRGAARSR